MGFSLFDVIQSLTEQQRKENSPIVSHQIAKLQDMLSKIILGFAALSATVRALPTNCHGTLNAAAPGGTCTNGEFMCTGDVVYQCNLGNWIVNADCGSMNLVCSPDH